jgi:hypothetical protein
MWGRGIGIPNGDLSYSLPWFFLKYLNLMLFDAIFSYLSIQFRPTSPGLESWAQDLEKSSSGLQDFQHRRSRSSGTSLLPQNVTGSGWTHHDTPVKPVKPVKPGVAHYWPWDRLWTRRNSLAVEVRKYYEMVRDFDIPNILHIILWLLKLADLGTVNWTFTAFTLKIWPTCLPKGWILSSTVINIIYI